MKTIQKNSLFLLLILVSTYAYSQNTNRLLPEENEINTLLPEIQVSGYLKPQFSWQVPASIGIIDKKEIELQSPISMVSAMNTIPGVRMEERSPGSYRLSIRGSLVRSPYGVRNVKVYYNDFSLTDGGGNTYLNALNVTDLSGVEVLKGPDGSLFGANSGGVVLLKSAVDTKKATEANIYTGSYGLVGNSVYVARNPGKHFLTVRQSSQRADGYRQNAKHYRLFFQLSDRWQYNDRNHAEILAFYSDLDYKTPGALTKEQYDEDPAQARQPTATLPGSVEQKTRINTKMYFAGIKHHAQLAPSLTHTISLWGNHVDFVYPFITNYEVRNEDNLGLRTFFTLANEEKHKKWKPSLDMGFEGQRMTMDTYNYDNHAGIKGDIQAYNDIANLQYFGFIRGKITVNDKLTFLSAISLNYNSYHFRDTTRIKNKLKPVWMPHFAINYRVNDPLALRLTVSKGYSPPTIAEIRPSDNKIYKDLQPEYGWNTEAGARILLLNGLFAADISAFHYILKNGIISQVDDSGNTFFVNSGRIKQLGVEYNSSWWMIPYTPGNRFIKSARWNSSYTYAHYHYDRYNTNEDDFSGNRVAGIPRNVFINNLYFDLPLNFYFYVQHNYTSRIALNDANTAFADSYNLLSAKVGLHPKQKKYLPASVYLSFDNILNEKYSLGNDINAYGGRYYNAAPTFNFILGLKWEL